MVCCCNPLRPSGGGGGSSVVFASLLATDGGGLDTEDNNGVILAFASATSGDAVLTASGLLFTLDAAFAVTYTGPTLDAMITCCATVNLPNGGGTNGFAAFVIGHNGDLIGGDVNGDPAFLAGAQYPSFVGNTGDKFWVPVTVQRRLTLASGDTFQPLCGIQQDIASNHTSVEALTLFLVGQ